MEAGDQRYRGTGQNHEVMCLSLCCVFTGAVFLGNLQFVRQPPSFFAMLFEPGSVMRSCSCSTYLVVFAVMAGCNQD
jgi:hypothetical protein